MTRRQLNRIATCAVSIALCASGLQAAGVASAEGTLTRKSNVKSASVGRFSDQVTVLEAHTYPSFMGQLLVHSLARDELREASAPARNENRREYATIVAT